MRKTLIVIICSAFLSCSLFRSVEMTGELNKWHNVTLTFTGPDLSEQSGDNPFADYRLEVSFSKGDKTVRVPGYYTADGNAGETGSDAGNKWRVHFMPDEAGTWEYNVSFRTGKDIALNSDPKYGTPAAFDGQTGSFKIEESDKTSRDFRAKGLLKYTGEHYLQFAGTGEYYLKGGADSPENFLAFFEFDGTPKATHKYEPHAGDWKPGDPLWQNGKGKNIIGALNYLAGKGMNSVYFLTMNVSGDGKDVWPWTNKNERYRFDCSKLDQWEIVFSHMDRLGLLMHVITQETENDTLLDNGDLGPQRKLYYRELIARFAHHPAIVWNLGEENTNTDEQRLAYTEFFEKTDPYDHPLVVHTFPGQYDNVYSPLLGVKTFEGPSLQMGNMKETHDETIKWVNQSASAGRKWFVCLDEIGPAKIGVKPDADDYRHDDVRRHALWGNLMGGGSGVEWYFGYSFPHNDLNCEDWRSRDHMWDLTRYALEFFYNYLPFWEMKPADDLLGGSGAYCFAKPGEIYAVYLPTGTVNGLNVLKGQYKKEWYNPRTGGQLIPGVKKDVTSDGFIQIGLPPAELDKDWVVLLREEK